MDVYSNAFNFGAHINGEVDSRTGQFGCVINLFTLFPKGPLQVSRQISLSFSMMNSQPSVYGMGWRMSNTEFDLATSRLTLLSGEQYQTDPLPSIGDPLWIKDYKLHDLVVKRFDQTTLHVIYKDGTIEILQRPTSTSPYRIHAIQFENGERFQFEYTSAGSLEYVFNEQRKELLVLDYENGFLSTVDVLVDGGRYARTGFSYSSGRLMSITVPYDRSGAVADDQYHFGYMPFSNGLIAINRLGSPMGGESQVTYIEKGHQYGNGQHIPRVDNWLHTPLADQPAVSRKYTYSTNNFTGFPFSGGFKEGRDNLYLVAGTYDYWSEETQVDTEGGGQVLCSTKTRFNKFHLVAEEQVSREDTVTTKTFTYNLDPGLFPDQPANFQLPGIITTSYVRIGGEATRTVQVKILTDEFGNELSRTEDSGVRTERSYYPVSGETNKCPADPHKLFQRYVKQERIIPAGGVPEARLTEYTHTRVPQTGSSYFVMPQSSSQAGLFSLQQTYFETPNTLAGRLKSTTSTIDGLVSVCDFSYTVTGDNLVETRRLKGREGQWLESVRTLSLTNRRILSMVRDGGCTLTMAYDVSGRLTQETVSPGTPQQAIRRFEYQFATPKKRAHLITTDAQKNKSITYFDGVGRKVSEAQLIGANQTQEQASGSWRYDALGQLVEEVSFDYLSDGKRELKSIHSYSHWGNASRITGPDGSVAINVYDPLLNVTEEGVEGGERRLTHFNKHNQPDKVERMDANNIKVEVESRTYDGLGRCLTVTDVNKTVTEFTYDAFDRLSTALQKPADVTLHRLRKVDYAPGTSDELATAITVAGKLLGTRAYDSLGRLTRQQRGTAQATSWEYEAGWMEPVVQVSPGGARQTLVYNKELDVTTSINMPGVGVSTYGHDQVSGALTRSETNGLIHESFLDANGHPAREVQTANGGALTSQYEHSPAGRLQRQTSADGQVSQFGYDARGRFIKMTSGAMVIEQTYDGFGRPYTLTTAHENTRIVTKVSYDALGREAERRFEQNGVLLQVMSSTYHLNGMLASRTIQTPNSEILVEEIFTYDAFLRLTSFRCNGAGHPQDQHGRGIFQQDFSFDSLNNITKVITFFVDGTQDICDRYFQGADPTQLTRITHSNPTQDVTLAYDAAGNLRASPGGHAYTFNAYDQLTDVQVATLKYSYQYDAESRQVLAARSNEQPVMLVYSGERLDTLVEGSKKIRYFANGAEIVSRSGGVDGPQLHFTDGSGSVRGVSAPGQEHVRRQYTPYGDTKIPLDDGKVRSMADLQLPALNGQRLDVSTNLYFLGNGRRAYDPGLMMFLQPDPLSPFDEGGINSYAYCAGNPINLMDPSGLFPTWLSWVFTGAALIMGVVSLGIGSAGIAAVGLAAATKVQIAGIAASVSGVIANTLGVTSLAIGAVDSEKGWDRSRHIKNLGWASFGFSLGAWSASIYNATVAGSTAYKAAQSGKNFERLGSFQSTSIDQSVTAFVRAATKSITGRNFKILGKSTSAGKTFASTFVTIRLINLARATVSRYNAIADGTSRPTDEKDGATPQAQPQQEFSTPQFVDMLQSLTQYYESFRDEAARIRQPITMQIYKNGT